MARIARRFDLQVSNDLSRCRHALSSIFAGADLTLPYGMVAYDYEPPRICRAAYQGRGKRMSGTAKPYRLDW
jgi:hypothetical protein